MRMLHLLTTPFKTAGPGPRRLVAALLLLSFGLRPALAAEWANWPGWRFEVAVSTNLAAAPKDGRLFVILGRVGGPEPRLVLGRPGVDAPPVLARDITGLAAGAVVVLDQTAFAFPITNLADLPAGDYVVQALFDSAADLRLVNAPGNWYSVPQPMHLEAARGFNVRVELTEQLPPERLPEETTQIKFVRIQSQLLTAFYGRPIFLRAGVILPRDYEREAARRYPLWVRIGGLNTRYTAVNSLMAERSEFRRTWLAEGTPRLLLLQLDGAGPNGDPYQVNSANNGPYGEALVKELIPFIEAKFHARGAAQARFLSGSSTGGWVSLALQVFYPDSFNGAWSSCPDPVDFRAFELLNIYADTNAYLNRHGHERPSERDARGDVVLTMRREVGVENLLGRGNSYTLSGQQWGEWTAVFGPRGADGLPAPLWEPRSGQMDPAVAEHWKKYDLRLVLQENWKTLGPKLRGKLHIAAGESDQYFLNNAVHLLEDSLAQADPPFAGKLVYGPRKLHGWMDLSLPELLQEMSAAAGP